MQLAVQANVEYYGKYVKNKFLRPAMKYDTENYG